MRRAGRKLRSVVMLLNKWQKWLGFLLVLLVVLGSMTSTYRQFVNFPQEIRLIQGDWKTLHLTMPASAIASVSDPDVVYVNGLRMPQVPVNLKQPMKIFSQNQGSTLLTLKLFGKLPIKKTLVQVMPPIQVIPGGQSIGVKMKSSGVLVVGHHLVQTSGEVFSPGEKADIRVGDYLVKMNHKPIRNMMEVAQLAEKAGKEKKPIDVTLIRQGKQIQTRITPAYDKNERAYRLGLYIRDTAAGVGTLTFYDPQRRVYGALGHVIADMDTGQAVRMGSGKIVPSSVISIQKGESGEPGEKRAIFFRENEVWGNIKKNTAFGIFGQMTKIPDHGYYQKPMPVALTEEVHEGPAKILTVVEGQKVEAFDIQIVHVLRQKYPATKGLIIKVTDKRLLDKTGGIVQGMSGSPIIQDGKIVGAVTHVFVNDPTSGYGTFIEWMLQDAGVIPSPADAEKGSAFLLDKFHNILVKKI